MNAEEKDPAKIASALSKSSCLRRYRPKEKAMMAGSRKYMMKLPAARSHVAPGIRYSPRTCWKSFPRSIPCTPMMPVAAT